MKIVKVASSPAKADLYNLVNRVAFDNETVHIEVNGRHYVTITAKRPEGEIVVVKTSNLKRNWSDAVAAINTLSAVFCIRVTPKEESDNLVRLVYFVKGEHTNELAEIWKSAK